MKVIYRQLNIFNNMEDMIKVKVEDCSLTELYCKLEFYDLISRIPLNIRLRNTTNLTNVVKVDSLSESGFVEFRFDRSSKRLIEVTVVSINNYKVKSVRDIFVNVVDDKEKVILFDDNVENFNNQRFQFSLNILKGSSSVCFIFNSDSLLNYYKAAKGFYIGVNKKNEFASFYLDNLSEQNIKDIFG